MYLVILGCPNFNHTAEFAVILRFQGFPFGMGFYTCNQQTLNFCSPVQLGKDLSSLRLREFNRACAKHMDSPLNANTVILLTTLTPTPG